MYQTIDKNSINEYFDESVEDILFEVIGKHLQEFLNTQTEIPKSAIMGAFVLEKVPLKTGDKLNIWVEYNGTIIYPVGIDTHIHKLIIFDEIPDTVLDSYNDLKKLEFEITLS